MNTKAIVSSIILGVLLITLSTSVLTAEKAAPVFPAASKSELKFLNPDRRELEAKKDVAMPFYPHRANTPDNKVIDHSQFEDAALCGGCHQEIYKQWKGSMMAQSWEDPIYRAILKRASEGTDGAVDNFCTGCHTPVGITTGLIDSEVNRMSPEESMKARPMPGIDCDGCHNMVGRTGMDNGAYIMNPKANGKPTKWGPRKDAVSPYHDTEYSELHTRSDFCGTCHNVTHPFAGVPVERTYDEWLESPYAENGEECQDCHMRPFKGQAAIGGPVRDDVASHWFSGANTTVINYFGDKEAADNARAMLQSAGEVLFVDMPDSLVPGQLANLSVKVKNKGAGHKLPTGFPEGREVWLDFKVTDSSGKEVYRLGAVKNGRTEPGTENFKVHLGDKDGNEVDLEVWTITHIISDNRILPNGYDVRNFQFVVPQDAKGPLTVSAELKYWPFPQYLVDYLLGEGELDVEIVTIDKTSTQLKVGQTVAMAESAE